jgi:hypothetical protein
LSRKGGALSKTASAPPSRPQRASRPRPPRRSRSREAVAQTKIEPLGASQVFLESARGDPFSSVGFVASAALLAAPKDASAYRRVVAARTLYATASRETGSPAQLAWIYEGIGAGASSNARYWCTSSTAIAPSPTAEATRLIEPARTSPTAKKLPGGWSQEQTGCADDRRPRGRDATAAARRQ